MKQQLFSLFVFIVFPGFVLAQEANNRNVACKSPIDSCKLCVTYSYRFQMDTIRGQHFYDRHILEIGERTSHYFSAYADKSDSLVYKARMTPGSPSGMRSTAWMKRDEKERYEDFWMNHPTSGVLSVLTGVYMREYLYEEPLPQMVWAMEDGQEVILGYTCQKAQTEFRGRTYEVWFTPDIPTRYGPWKFNGLPGLILRAQDREQLFVWEAIGLESPRNRLIYRYDPQKGKNVPGAPDMKIIKTDRLKFRKVQQKLWSDPVGLRMQQGGIYELYNMTTKESHTCSPGEIVKPYIPTLELE